MSTPTTSHPINVNIGVLGHIDSGKTSLCRTLSQITSTASLDKHPQSRERGITLDLGFSSFSLEMPVEWFERKTLISESSNSTESTTNFKQLQCTLVDCPGHASLLKTVIGGAQIIDICLLVIDCQKGIQPQTAECLVVAELLCNQLIVVINKVDMLGVKKEDVKGAEIETDGQKETSDATQESKKLASDSDDIDPSHPSNLPQQLQPLFKKLRAIFAKKTKFIEHQSLHFTWISATSNLGVSENFLERTLKKKVLMGPQTYPSLFPPRRQGAQQSSQQELQISEKPSSQAQNQQQQQSFPLLLSFDHAFRIKGQGMVLTSTVLSGSIQINSIVDLPQLGEMGKNKRVRSLQMFRKSVKIARQGDRVAVCIPQIDTGPGDSHGSGHGHDSNPLERGWICDPKYPLPRVYSLIAVCHKLVYYRGAVKSRAKFHLTVGHDTVMAKAQFFCPRVLRGGAQQQSGGIQGQLQSQGESESGNRKVRLGYSVSLNQPNQIQNQNQGTKKQKQQLKKKAKNDEDSDTDDDIAHITPKLKAQGWNQIASPVVAQTKTIEKESDTKNGLDISDNSDSVNESDVSSHTRRKREKKLKKKEKKALKKAKKKAKKLAKKEKKKAKKEAKKAKKRAKKEKEKAKKNKNKDKNLEVDDDDEDGKEKDKESDSDSDDSDSESEKSSDSDTDNSDSDSDNSSDSETEAASKSKQNQSKKKTKTKKTTDKSKVKDKEDQVTAPESEPQQLTTVSKAGGGGESPTTKMSEKENQTNGHTFTPKARTSQQTNTVTEKKKSSEGNGVKKTSESNGVSQPVETNYYQSEDKKDDTKTAKVSSDAKADTDSPTKAQGKKTSETAKGQAATVTTVTNATLTQAIPPEEKATVTEQTTEKENQQQPQQHCQQLQVTVQPVSPSKKGQQGQLTLSSSSTAQSSSASIGQGALVTEKLKNWPSSFDTSRTYVHLDEALRSDRELRYSTTEHEDIWFKVEENDQELTTNGTGANSSQKQPNQILNLYVGGVIFQTNVTHLSLHLQTARLVDHSETVKTTDTTGNQETILGRGRPVGSTIDSKGSLGIREKDEIFLQLYYLCKLTGTGLYLVDASSSVTVENSGLNGRTSEEPVVHTVLDYVVNPKTDQTAISSTSSISNISPCLLNSQELISPEPACYVHLELEKPLLIPPESLLIASKLDFDQYSSSTASSNSGPATSAVAASVDPSDAAALAASAAATNNAPNHCRLAFFGRMLTHYSTPNPQNTKSGSNQLEELIEVVRMREKVGLLERLDVKNCNPDCNDSLFIVKDMFKLETDLQLFLGLRVVHEASGRIGVIEATFGQSGGNANNLIAADGPGTEQGAGSTSMLSARVKVRFSASPGVGMGVKLDKKGINVVGEHRVILEFKKKNYRKKQGSGGMVTKIEQ